MSLGGGAHQAGDAVVVHDLRVRARSQQEINDRRVASLQQCPIIIDGRDVGTGRCARTVAASMRADPPCECTRSTRAPRCSR